MMEERPLIDDTPGKPAHPMTDEQYERYKKLMENLPKNPVPRPSPEQEIAGLKQQNEEMRRVLVNMTMAYREGVNEA